VAVRALSQSKGPHNIRGPHIGEVLKRSSHTWSGECCPPKRGGPERMWGSVVGGGKGSVRGCKGRPASRARQRLHARARLRYATWERRLSFRASCCAFCVCVRESLRPRNTVAKLHQDLSHRGCSLRHISLKEIYIHQSEQSHLILRRKDPGGVPAGSDRGQRRRRLQ